MSEFRYKMVERVVNPLGLYPEKRYVYTVFRMPLNDLFAEDWEQIDECAFLGAVAYKNYTQNLEIVAAEEQSPFHKLRSL